MTKEATFPLAQLQPNDRNPRYITEAAFDDLVDSLLGFPEMLYARGIVYKKNKTGKKNTIFGANQRFRALLSICEMDSGARAERIRKIVEHAEEIGKLSVPSEKRIAYLVDFWTPICITREVPARWMNDATTWTPEQLEEFTIRDNVSSGAWDMEALANGWEPQLLKAWGVPVWAGTEMSEDDIEQFFSQEEHPQKDPTFNITLKYSEDDYRAVTEAFKNHSGSREDIVARLLGV